jgi:hypothetical protein
MPHTQADLRNAHHEVRKVLSEIARLKRQRESISRRKRQSGNQPTFLALQRHLRQAIERRRTIRAALAATTTAELEVRIVPQDLISAPVAEFAPEAAVERSEDFALTADNDEAKQPAAAASGERLVLQNCGNDDGLCRSARNSAGSTRSTGANSRR